MRICRVDLGIDTLPVLNDGDGVAGAAAVQPEAIVGLSGKNGIALCSRWPGVMETARAVEAETAEHARLSALLSEG